MSDTGSSPLSEGMLSTLQLNSQPSTFPECGNKSRLELPTNLLNFRKIINYIPPQFKHLSHLFPSIEIHLCFSSPSDDVNGYNPPRAYSGERGSAKECGRCRVSQLAGHCSRVQWGLKGIWEDTLGPREGKGKGPSSSSQIACLCGSQRPYIASTLIPIYPRLVFHLCPSGCNGVPGCLDGWRCGCCWQPLLEHHSFLSRSPKTWVIAIHHTGEMCHSPYNFSLPFFSFQPLTLLFFCIPQIVYSFFPRFPFCMHALRPFQHCGLVLSGPFHLKPDTLR